MHRRRKEEGGLSVSTEEVKTCAKCGETKQAGQFRTRRATCKPCQAEYDRQYYAENRDKAREYRTENRDKIAERHRQYRAENRDKNAEYQRQYYAENRDKIVEHQRQYRAENRDKIAEYHLQYYSENRDKKAEYLRQYRAALPDACVAQEIKRGTTLTRADIPPELLEAKRLQLKLKRLAREAMK